MIFKEITLENFRQYRGEHVFSFPVNGDKKITLMIARNGVGKTTFLQAFRFCFFGENQGALKLPKSEDLITNSLENTLDVGESTHVMISIKFEHAGHDFIAKRRVEFTMGNNGLQRIDRPGGTFELLEEDPIRGVIKVEDSEQRILQMMPVGLAHVYMFDGERVEMPISEKKFQDGLKTSIVGVLGLEKLQQAYDFLGSKEKSKSVIGKIWKKTMTVTSSEQQVLEREDRLKKENEDKKREIEEKKRTIAGIEEKIKEGRAEQTSILELKSLTKQVEIAEKNVELKNNRLKLIIHEANTLSAQLLLKVQVAKIYEKYQNFLDSAEDEEEIYENLYSSVIDDILKRGICICGRSIQEGDDYTKHLKSLIALPQDNAAYLNNLTSLFKSLDDMPARRKQLIQKNSSILKAKMELEQLRKEQEKAENDLKEAEEKKNGDSIQINIEFLRDKKVSFEHTIRNLSEEIDVNDRKISGLQGEINRIRTSIDYNVKVSEAIDMLESLKMEIGQELENKKKIARESIEENMNTVLAGITNQTYASFLVELDSDYGLTVYRHIGGTDEYEETTEVLSTGQNVVMYLSFLRALLLTISQHAEFSDVSKNGVIMDAALSNVDEEHIKQISTKILSEFDQLIFLSYKGQLRNELIAGIKDNVSMVYELSKNEYGDIEQIELEKDEIENYVNEGMEE